MQQLVRPIISVVLIVLSVLGLSNVYSDNSDVLGAARGLACETERCEANLRQVQRTPLSQELHFAITGGEVVIVECARSLLFVGEYSCKKQ
jgi:hypothetical protein